MKPEKRTLLFMSMIIALLGFGGPVFAQEEMGSNFDFGLDLGLGTQTFQETEVIDGIPQTVPQTYQSLSLSPDLAFGKFGLGLNLNLHYTFTGGENNSEFEIRSADWVPQ